MRDPKEVAADLRSKAERLNQLPPGSNVTPDFVLRDAADTIDALLYDDD